MLTRLRIKNFKRFDYADVDLGQNVILIGPNNSGKTSALQALALWDLAVRRWHEKRSGKTMPKKKTGVALNRRDLLSLPVPEAKLLWHDLRVRDVTRPDGSPKVKNLRIRIDVEGVVDGDAWSCGMEFDYSNTESLYCRPCDSEDERPPVPSGAMESRIAYLPPMSGLVANELRLDPGAIQVRIGEGRTAEVLRNLCYGLHESASSNGWLELVRRTRELFGVELSAPAYVPERGELTMTYRENDNTLDLSASGRGLQQTVLLLAYMLGNPGAVLLLDEPDAHLEILRQRQIYDVLTSVARSTSSQIIAASHSEVLLNEAADRDVVVAFVGPPHRIDDRGSQVAKALKSIGFEHYVQAELVRWVLYLEGSTDLAILRAFAAILEHPARSDLERPYVHYVGNQRSKAREHFFGLREACPNLLGLVITDPAGERYRQGKDDPLVSYQWRMNEIENYLCFPEALESYAARLAHDKAAGPLFQDSLRDRFVETMRDAIAQRVPPAALKDRDDDWWRTIKATDQLLDPLFKSFFERLELPHLMRKSDYHELAALVPRARIDPEVSGVLDAIVQIATRVQPTASGLGEGAAG
ncbi:MAG: AAA family ATPase [Proteobacteria bacterium]|nr:AAA family ATPase [Pseudomonadota bacterium]